MINFGDVDLEKCVSWIENNNYEKVALQFPDHLLAFSVEIALQIQKRIRGEIYIMADSTYGSCCVDEITAKHVEANAVIHFGDACFSPFKSLPVLYIFPKCEFHIESFIRDLNEFRETLQTEILILYDVSYHYLIDDLRKYLDNKFAFVSKLPIDEDNSVNTANSISVAKRENEVCIFGRIFCIPNCISDYSIVYLTAPKRTKNLDNFITKFPNTNIYSYNSECKFQREDIPTTIKRSFYRIEKVKNSERVGILVSTVTVDGYLDVIQRLKCLCANNEKKANILYVGKLNPAKLANFPEIDVFVLVQCAEAEIPDSSEYYKPIVTVMEAEFALNPDQIWNGSLTADFRDFLLGGCEYKELPKERNTDAEVSLISNDLKSFSLAPIEAPTENSLSVRESMPVCCSSIDNGLHGRSWKGLELNVGCTPVEKATIGRTGTPAAGYTYPECKQLS